MYLLFHQVKIHRAADRERHRFNGEHSHGSPPGQGPRSEAVVRKLSEVEYKPRSHHPSRSIESPGLGQNQPIRVIATGTAPMYRPQGVKIDRTNRKVAASAARKGQSEGSAEGSRRSGSASPAVVSSNSRRSRRKP